MPHSPGESPSAGAAGGRAARLAALLVPVLLSLGTLGVYAWVAIHVTSPPPPFEHFPPQQTRWERLAHWDGGWYRTVAEQGYGPRGAPQTTFLPLFPFLTAAVHRVLPAVGLVKEGIALNVAATCAAMAVVDRTLARLGWPAWQRWLTVALLLTLPGAFFYTAFYAEALFVLAAALVLYGVLVPGAIWWAVAGSILGTLDRPPGALLALGVGVVLLPRLRQEPLRVVGMLAASLSGAVVLLLFYWWQAGNPVAFVSSTRLWKTDHLLYMGFDRARRDLHVELFLLPGYHAETASGLWEWLVSLPLVALAWRWRPALGAIAAALVAVALLMGGVDSQARFLVVILPLWIGVLGLLRRWPLTWAGVLAAIPTGLYLNIVWTGDFARWIFAG